MDSLLKELAETNLSGAPFLFAYGATWTGCGVLWRKLSAPRAAIATLFQGMFALPVALFILFRMGALTDRPETGELDGLVILMAMSQLLVLPLLIVMFSRKHYYLIPLVFSAGGAVHFLMYTWLYQTVAYIIMPVLIVVVISAIYYSDPDKDFSAAGASRVCWATGAALLLNAAYLSLSHTLK